MNIQFNYLYRDGANYKQFHFEVFANRNDLDIKEIEQAIKACLIDEMWFYADKWLLKKDMHRYEWDNEIDHDWHEYESVELTEEDPTVDDITEFIKLINHPLVRK